MAMTLALVLLAGSGGCATAPRPAPSAATSGESGRGKSRTIVFIHGMFVTPSCWEGWEAYFREKGFRTLAPAWPEHDPPAGSQRAKHPNPALAALTLGDLVSH